MTIVKIKNGNEIKSLLEYDEILSDEDIKLKLNKMIFDVPFEVEVTREGDTFLLDYAQPVQMEELDLSRIAILNRIYEVCTQPELFALADVLDKKASFIAAIDNQNWQLAAFKIYQSWQEGLISGEMYGKIIQFLPPVT